MKLQEHVDASRETAQRGRLYSVEEAAGFLGVSESMVRKLAGDGRLEVVRIGRRVLVPPTEVARLMRGS